MLMVLTIITIPRGRPPPVRFLRWLKRRPRW